MSRILIIQGHPDTQQRHFCHALADAYAEGAREGGHEVARIDVAQADIPFLRSRAQWEGADAPAFVGEAQERLAQADHLVLVYPLWLGTMPALLKAWLEHVLRPGFAFDVMTHGLSWNARLGGLSARLIVTMGMPVFVYRLFYLSHSLRTFQRNILRFVGVSPVRTSLIGRVDARGGRERERWLARIRAMGERAR